MQPPVELRAMQAQMFALIQPSDVAHEGIVGVILGAIDRTVG